MPVEFKIFPSRNLVISQFAGHILLNEVLSTAKIYAEHPNAHPTQNQLLDMRALTSYERDLVGTMSVMAQLPEHLLHPGFHPLVVYLAPGRAAQEISSLVIKSMQGISGMLVSAVAEELHALEILGLPEQTLAEILATA